MTSPHFEEAPNLDSVSMPKNETANKLIAIYFIVYDIEIRSYG